MLDRRSLVNVTLKIRSKFHSNRLVNFRDILHTVSKNPVSRKTRSRFQNVIFHTYPLLTFFTYTSTALTIHNQIESKSPDVRFARSDIRTPYYL